MLPDSYAEFPMNKDMNTKTKNIFFTEELTFDLNMSPKPNLEIIPRRELNSWRYEVAIIENIIHQSSE